MYSKPFLRKSIKFYVRFMLESSYWSNSPEWNSLKPLFMYSMYTKFHHSSLNIRHEDGDNILWITGNHL
jgi:hypothetical protein